MYKQHENIKEINSHLKNVNFEDIKVINQIEKIFIRKRGYVFKIPRPNSPIVLLMSGGLDSVVMVSILINEFRLRIFPMFVNWGQNNYKKEKEALNFFSTYYFKKYPRYFNRPKEIKFMIPSEEINMGVKDIVILRNAMFANLGVEYASYLNEKYNLPINTIFCSSVSTDGILVPDSTLTSIRSNNLNICLNEGNFNWQYTSIALERSMGLYFSKEYLIKYSLDKNIPLEKTWSCYRKTKLHCGKCLPCQGRKDAFLKSGVEDLTVYISK